MSYPFIEQLLEFFRVRNSGLVFHFFNDCIDESCLDSPRPLQLFNDRLSKREDRHLWANSDLLNFFNKFDAIGNLLLVLVCGW